MPSLDAYLYDAVRTPRGAGKDSGALHGVKPVELLAPLYRALLERTPGLRGDDVDDVVLGCSVQTLEQGSNLAKISAMFSGFSERCSGVTLNRFCASGLDALAYGALKVSSGMESLIVAGGVESLSRVSMFADQGPWFSDKAVARASRFLHMGASADVVAALGGFTRADCDAYALRSQQRAAQARQEGRFSRSLVPVRGEDGAVLLAEDECIRPSTTLEKLAALPAAFGEFLAQAEPYLKERYPALAGGKVTPVHHVGCAPVPADGASLLLLGNKAAGERLGQKPRVRIRSFGNVAVEPVAMLNGLAPAAEKALRATGLTVKDIDLFECNESFAAPVLTFMRTLELDPERVNVNGGAIAMGHPLGATGGMLVMTLLDELERQDKTLGLAAICAGAGIAEAAVVERCG